MKLASYSTAFGVYLALWSLMTISYWGSGEVIAPYRQLDEVGLTSVGSPERIENRKFADFALSYIPEIAAHLQGRRSGQLTLWTNKNELGRPVYQISGFSPAYPPSWVIAQFTDSPWEFITVLSLLTCFFAGVFVMLFCREIELAPLAALIAGCSLAASPLFMYWLAFPMFAAVCCWAAGALWGVTRIAKAPDLAGWSVLAFSGYSILMTGYPQAVVFNFYILGGFGLVLAHKKRHLGWTEVTKFLLYSLSGGYPLAYDGISVTPLMTFFAVLAVLLLIALLAAQQHVTRPPLLLAALMVVLTLFSFPLMLRQYPADIATTSP